MYRGGGGQHSRGRDRGGSRELSSKTSRTAKGLFANGFWQCNCSPRLPAEHFKVKKEGKNQGRWFYTCQNAPPERCDFFLWDEDAKPREEAAVLSNSHTEPTRRQNGNETVQGGGHAVRAARAARTDAMGMRGAVKGRGLFAARSSSRDNARQIEDDDETQDPSPRLNPQAQLYEAIPPGGTAKRTARQAGINDDASDNELFTQLLTDEEEQELMRTADTATTPGTPHKALRTGVYATPVTTTTKRRLPWLEAGKSPNTPNTASSLSNKAATGYADTPSKSTVTAAASGTNLPSANIPLAMSTNTGLTTPSALSRFRDALSDPADASSSLTSEALTAIEGCDLPKDVRDKLRSVLTKHDLKMQGVIKGRDIARLAIKAKKAKIAEFEAKIAGLENAKITELQAKISSLEAEREVDRSIITHLKWQLIHGEGKADTQETIA